MNAGTRAWLMFKEYAFRRGFREKVIGDLSFSRTRNPRSPILKLISTKGGRLLVFETGVGRYEVDKDGAV